MIRKLLIGLLLLVLLAVVLALIAVAVVDPDDYRDEIAQRASETLGREVRLDGPMSLSLFPWLALEIEDVVVGNPPVLADAPPLARIGKAVASVRVMPLLGGQMETGDITLSEAQLTLIAGPNDQSNLDGLLEEADPTADTPPLNLTGLNLGTITLEQVDLVQLDLLSDARTTLAIDRMVLDAFAPERPVGFSLQASLSDDSGELLVFDELTGELRVALDASEVAISDLLADYRLPGGDMLGQATGQARIQRGDALSLAMSEFQTELQAGGQTLGLALSEPLTLVLGDDIDLGLTNARLSLNDQTLQASGRVRLADRLRADLMVSGETLDLRPLTSAAPDTESDSSREVDFSALESIDLEFRLDLDQLLVSDALTLTDVVSETRLQAGRLALAPLQARLFGGAFNGRVDVDFTQAPPAVTVQPELSGIAIDQLAALSGAAAPLSGLADAQLDLDFSGMDLPSILASMNGAGRIEIANGALEGVDLRRLISEELTVSNLSNVSQAFGGRTDFDTLEAGVEVVDGVLELPDLNLAAADFGVQGQGRVDFAADRIDYRLQLNLGPELTQRLPGTLRDATRGRIPLAIAGPVAQPIVTIDFNSLLESALRRQITERLLAPRVEDGDETPSGDEGQTDSASSDEASAEGTSEEEPERERTSQLLLRGLLERALEDDEEASDETETEEGGDEPPPS